ncbi:MAG TPA: hypothetical protein VFV99_17095 [Kofleriaceae bacterium]|nr:hypothetical protein [Kofleriaceae bacterium]
MRWLALAPLVAATGCNWLYGLDATIAVDGASEGLPPGSRTRLVWGIATTDGQAGTSGFDPEMVYKSIGSETARPQPPVVLVGDDSGLAEATYDPADGSFEIPYALRESPHRVVYTLPGESVPHEVQWSITGAILVVPRTTRLDAPAPPTASGYSITPQGLGTTLAMPALYTSGAFTATDSSSQFDQATAGTIKFAFPQNARPVTSPLGAPQKAKGDWVLLVNFQPNGAQTSVNGFAMSQIDLAANMMLAPNPQPTWQTTTRTLSTICSTMPANCLPNGNAAPAAQRLDAVLPGGTAGRKLFLGVSPSTDLPGFLPGVGPDFVDRPLMLTLHESTQIDTTITLADPSSMLGLDRVIAARLTSARLANGAVLTSSIQTITNVFSGSLQYGAPLATNVKLGATSLSGTTESVPVGASSSQQTLSWSAEAGYVANDYVVTLYEITFSALVPVRIYHVIAPEVKVDGNLLVAGHQYVFGITARTGFGAADRGDYQKAQYPFSVTTTFPRTFTVQ